MTTIAFLACATTMPGSSNRREDAFEHDRMVDALVPAFEGAGLSLKVIDWEAPLDEFRDVACAIIGTTWNYQDLHAEFLSKLTMLEQSGIEVHNPAGLVEWNSSKTYLRELADNGAATIPTLWLDDPNPSDLERAFEQFGSDRIVIKRQIGAGAEGQMLIDKGDLPANDWRYGHPAMVQPFLPTIQSDGEYSLIFVQGEFSHALRKVAAEGEYRIQSLYGGIEQNYAPNPAEIAAAKGVVSAIPFAVPLYARIDMVRAEDGSLLLMEAEMIEPYLYPEQGPLLGAHLARALSERVAAR